MYRKHWSNLKYLLRHKKWVYWAGRRLGLGHWQLITHDWSKFLPSEWFPYARYFEVTYPRSDELELAFDMAWLLHIHRQPHHPQYWHLRNDSGQVRSLPMPEKYIREMLADWVGAEIAQRTPLTTQQWYNRMGAGYRFHPKTKARIEELLKEYHDLFSNIHWT